MRSWQSYVLNPVLRYAVRRKVDRAMSIEQLRTAFGPPMRGPKGAVFAPGSIGGVAGEWATGTPGATATMLYLHGGGYTALSPLSYRPISGAFANLGFRIFVPDYRLAPEHPFPAALDDALAVYHGLLAQGIAPARLVIAGDSAGGGLTVATLLAAKAAGLPMPACAILFAPWTDLAATGESLITNLHRDVMLSGNRIINAAALYLAGADAKNPLASPLYGDLAGLPPLFIQASDVEVLRDDSTRLAERAAAAGVAVEVKIWPGLPHVWQLFQAFLPEARAALAAAGDFARRHLA